jgi:hypothetical protein
MKVDDVLMPKVDRLLEVVGHRVRAMIATQLLFGGDVLGNGAEVHGHALAERRQGLRGDDAILLCLPGRAPLRCGAAWTQTMDISRSYSCAADESH